MYIKIKTDYLSMLKLLVGMIIFVDTQYLYLLKYDTNTLHTARTVLAIFGVFFLAYLYDKDDFKNILGEYKYIYIYILITALVVGIQSIYSMITYGENPYDMIWGCARFLCLFFLPLFVYLFEKCDANKFISRIIVIGIVSVLLILFLALAKDYGIPVTLPGARFFGVRDGHTRVSITNAGRIAIVYLFAYIIQSREWKRKIYLSVLLALMLVAFIYFQATRIANIALVVAFIAILVFYRGSNNKKLIYAFIVSVAILIIWLNKNVLFESFSTSGEQAASTIARLNGTAYFLDIFKGNPLTGLGIIRPKNQELMLIWAGPLGIYYLDDLGIIGGLFETGLVGIVLYIYPILRMSYISYKLYKLKNNVALFSIGMTVYTVVTQASLSFLSLARVMGTVICWAYLEYILKIQSQENNTAKYKIGELNEVRKN